MTHFYSFEVFAAHEVVFPEHMLAIGEGPDVFNLTLDNLEEFLAKLQKNDVRVLKVNNLDELDEVPPVTLDLSDPSGQNLALEADTRLLFTEGSPRNNR